MDNFVFWNLRQWVVQACTVASEQDGWLWVPFQGLEACDELATLGSKVTWLVFGVLKAFRLSSERLLEFWRGWRVPFTWETKRLHDSEKQSSCLNFTFTTTMTWTSETFTDSSYSKLYRQCIQFSVESFLNAHKSQETPSTLGWVRNECSSPQRTL